MRNKFKKGNKASLGIKRSKKTIEKIRNSHIGMKPTEETKLKLKKAKTGVNNPMFGRKKELCPNYNKKQSEITKQKRREWNIAHPNKKFCDTKIELAIEAELIKRGINYVKQVPLCKITIVDFYLPEHRIIIFADGCYWHNCPICPCGQKRELKDKDLKQTNVLTFNGFNVYRFWEHEINESVENCIDRLML